MLVYMGRILQNAGTAITEPDKYFGQLFILNKLCFYLESATETKSSLSKVHGELRAGTTENMTDTDEYK